MKIGFYGDSFCQDLNVCPTLNHDYETYIKKLSNHYNAEITSLGVGGSSIWDTILLQFDENILPDVCVFVWTEQSRLFHREVRNINYASQHTDTDMPKDIKDSAQMYYKYLFDWDLSNYQYISALHYFDNVILSKFTNTKIIHLWAFGCPNINQPNIYDPRLTTYHYNWKHGVEIRPSLITVSEYDNTNSYMRIIADDRPNHIDGDEKNEMVFNWIKTAIDEYEIGKCFDFIDDSLRLKKS